MPCCCPPGLGCNARTHDEPCALELCQGAAQEEPQAALAALRWTQLQEARRQPRGKSDRRFRLRAYQRARESALVALLMHAGGPGPRPRLPARQRAAPFSRRPRAARPRRP